MTTATTTPSTADATMTVLRTEARLFGREPGSLFWMLGFPTILLVILGLIPSFREASPDLGGQRLIDLYASVTVILAIIFASLMAMPGVVTSYRERGILKRLRTTPVRPGSLLLAQALLHGVAVFGSIVLALAVSHLAFDVPLPGNLGMYVVVLVLTVTASFGMGAVITALSPTTRLAQTIATIVFFPSMFTAGVYLPVQAMTGTLHDVVTLMPLGAAAEALNASLVGDQPASTDLVVLAVWSIGLAAIAIRFFKWE
jgi:ABC-2 type transport system permease protein